MRLWRKSGHLSNADTTEPQNWQAIRKNPFQHFQMGRALQGGQSPVTVKLYHQKSWYVPNTVCT